MDNKLQEARNTAIEGMNALSAGRGPEAEARFLRAIELGWPGADVWILLSHARSQTRNIEGAEAALKHALSLEPQNPRALLYMGAFLEACGQTSRARSFHEQGITLGEAVIEKTPELRDLLQGARRFLAAAPATGHHPVDDFIKLHGLGKEPEDDLLIESLQILAERKRPYVSQPSRFLYAGLPSRQYFRREEFPWVQALEARTGEIKQELEALLAEQEASRFAPYVEKPSQGGAPADLPIVGNPDWSALYLLKQGTRIEENISRFPKTWAAIEAIGSDARPPPQPSVLFSLLKPGAHIPAHVGMFNTRLICHLPLIVPEDCRFRVGNETRQWEAGKMFLFDDSINHEAWNDSDQPRYILIFEIWRPELSARQRHLLTELFAPGF